MPTIAEQRLHNQQLAHTTCRTSGDVVAWLGAVQAQEYALAKWGLGLRLHGATDAAIEQAFTDGAILRTHVMRPTWHFVTPADIRWLLDLTAPRVHAGSAYMYRRLELDDALLRRCYAAITKALEGGNQRTRLELAAALRECGVVADGQRLAYIVMHAELEGLICSGARRGKQFTYALLHERAPLATTLDRDAALAELTKRYFTSHGPATVQDFAWWSGLTVADVKAGLALTKGHVERTVVDGKAYWHAALPSVNLPQAPTVLLLPPYDEYVIAYKDHRAILDPMHAEQAKAAMFGGATVLNGEVIGNWRRTFRGGTVVIESAPFRPLSGMEHAAFAAAAERFGAFLGMPVVLA